MQKNKTKQNNSNKNNNKQTRLTLVSTFALLVLEVEVEDHAGSWQMHELESYGMDSSCSSSTFQEVEMKAETLQERSKHEQR